MSLNDFAPLSIVEQTKGEKLIAAAPIFQIMKQVGGPLVLDLFRPYFKKFLEKYGTRAVTFLKGPKYKLPIHVEAAGITLSQTNFSIVLHTQELFHNSTTFNFQRGLRS